MPNFERIIRLAPLSLHHTSHLEMTPTNPLPNPKLPLGCPILTRFLRGGLPINTITELVGESSTGKTQLCLQLLLSASPSPSLYLHSDSPFPSRRLHSLSPSPSPLYSIFPLPLHNAYHLLDLLPRLDTIIPRLKLKLLIIDSIAGLFRAEFGNNREDLMERSRLFFTISKELKRLAVKYGVAVVVTNQVGDVVEGGEGVRIGNAEWLVSSGRRVAPALGLAWSHCVNMRLFMSREDEMIHDEGGGEGEGDGESVKFRTRRFIRVVFAPHLPDSSCQFVIEREGVFGIDR